LAELCDEARALEKYDAAKAHQANMAKIAQEMQKNNQPDMQAGGWKGVNTCSLSRTSSG